MISVRSLARVAPRVVPRATSTIARTPVVSRLRSQHVARAFSTSMIRGKSAGQNDKDVINVLDSEFKHEKEEDKKREREQPKAAIIEDFLETSPFKVVEDNPGRGILKLQRTFGNEKITITFNTQDIHDDEVQNSHYDEEDPALGDEDLDAEDSHEDRHEDRHDKRRSKFDENEEMDEEDMMMDPDSEGRPPLRCNLEILIEKPGVNQGALNVLAEVQDGAVGISCVHYYKDVKLVNSESDKSAELYLGPPFGTLDQNLQNVMEHYLEERGLNEALALFVPEFMEKKEHNEYMSWLTNVKKFVEA